jgi:hypothetical protein
MGIETPEAIEQSYQRMLLEIRLDDFCALWYYLSVWGQKPIPIVVKRDKVRWFDYTGLLCSFLKSFSFTLHRNLNEAAAA